MHTLTAEMVSKMCIRIVIENILKILKLVPTKYHRGVCKWMLLEQRKL
jgi:hypothetical protein